MRPEPRCWPAVFVETMVCCGCSLLQAQKNRFCPLSFSDFRKIHIVLFQVQKNICSRSRSRTVPSSWKEYVTFENVATQKQCFPTYSQSWVFIPKSHSHFIKSPKVVSMHNWFFDTLLLIELQVTKGIILSIPDRKHWLPRWNKRSTNKGY